MAQEQPDKKKRPMHENHRTRMRRRVEEYGLESLAEHEVLEYLLFFAIPRQDTNPIAHRLLDQFKSLPNVLEASEEELCTVEGVGPSTARFLRMLHSFDRYYAVSRNPPAQKLETTEQYANYIVPLFRGLKQENLLLLALNDRGKLLRTIWLASGSVGSVEVSVAKVASQVLSAGASVVVLAHNHPGGLALPSQDDIITTGNIMRALGVLQVRVRDHIIVADGEYTSLRDTGRLPYYNFRTGELRYFCT